MSKGLSADAIASFDRDGFYFPFRVLSESDALACRRRLEAFETAYPNEINKLDLKPHLLMPWLDDLTRRPALVDVAEGLFGPDLMCCTTAFRIKEPNSDAFAGWHQDSMYIKIRPILGIWLGFTAATAENGCLRVMPGSHKWPLLPHRDADGTASFLTRGQYITAAFDDSAAVDMKLRPGEAGIFHINLVHSSNPNRSDDRRIGFLPGYCPTAAVNQGPRDSATLVRGTDVHRHFEHEPRPDYDLSPVAIEAHRRANTLTTKTMYRGSDRTPRALA